MPHPHAPARYFHIAGGLLTLETRLRHPAHYRTLLKTVAAQLDTPHVQLLAFCLLPNAWHLVVSTRGTRRLEALVSGVRDTHRRVSRAEGQPMPIAITQLSTGAALLGRCVMVERRPIATGLVRHAQDWPWGSAAERFRLQARVPLASPNILLSQTWFDHLNAPRHGDVSFTVRRDNLAQPPRRLTAEPQVVHKAIRVGRGAHEDHADAHVEGAEHLRVGHAAGSLQPVEQRRHGPARTVE